MRTGAMCGRGRWEEVLGHQKDRAASCLRQLEGHPSHPSCPRLLCSFPPNSLPVPPFPDPHQDPGPTPHLIPPTSHSPSYPTGYPSSCPRSPPPAPSPSSGWLPQGGRALGTQLREGRSPGQPVTCADHTCVWGAWGAFIRTCSAHWRPLVAKGECCLRPRQDSQVQGLPPAGSMDPSPPLICGHGHGHGVPAGTGTGRSEGLGAWEPRRGLLSPNPGDGRVLRKPLLWANAYLSSLELSPDFQPQEGAEGSREAMPRPAGHSAPSGRDPPQRCPQQEHPPRGADLVLLGTVSPLGEYPPPLSPVGALPDRG